MLKKRERCGPIADVLPTTRAVKFCVNFNSLTFAPSGAVKRLTKNNKGQLTRFYLSTNLYIQVYLYTRNSVNFMFIIVFQGSLSKWHSRKLVQSHAIQDQVLVGFNKDMM